MISGILLAAGSSTRMGKENKLLLPFKGKPLFIYALEAMKNADLDELIVVLGHDYPQMLPYFHDCNIRLAINGNHLEGQTSSIQAGIQMISPSSKAVMIGLADMPLLTSAHLNILIKAFEGVDNGATIMKPFNGTTPGNPVLFSKSFYDDLLSCPDPDGCRWVIQQKKSCLHKYETTDPAFFRDIDTPHDYQTITDI